ncbi:MAG: hypothetical protein ACK5KU_03670 [Beutenbergiaceae bacterium]
MPAERQASTQESDLHDEPAGLAKNHLYALITGQIALGWEILILAGAAIVAVATATVEGSIELASWVVLVGFIGTGWIPLILGMVSLALSRAGSGYRIATVRAIVAMAIVPLGILVPILALAR